MVRTGAADVGGSGRPQSILPLPFQLEAAPVAFEDGRLEVGRLERAPYLAAAGNFAVPFRNLLAEPPKVALVLLLVVVLVLDLFSDGRRRRSNRIRTALTKA
jgi:hypothetical protein